MSELLILKEIMERIRHQQNLDSTPFPYEYFNLMGGTGTGGFVAILSSCCTIAAYTLVFRAIVLMLGRLRMSIDDALKYYDILTKKVFSEGKKVIGNGKFKATALEHVIKDIVKTMTGDANSPMMDTLSDGDACKTYVMVPITVSMRD
jgi:hypothetical protein